MRNSAKRGFTLIELLVVVAIIALLIAILLPSLSRAKSIATRTKCAAVLRGWGEAINTYAADWDGVFAAKSGTETWAAIDATGGLYGDYLNKLQKNIRTCPGDPSL